MIKFEVWEINNKNDKFDYENRNKENNIYWGYFNQYPNKAIDYCKFIMLDRNKFDSIKEIKKLNGNDFSFSAIKNTIKLKFLVREVQ